jgi:deoxyribodipyrimidine photo-lyase
MGVKDVIVDETFEKRLTRLNDRGARSGKCVLYWMQSSIRVSDNPALEFAIERANSLSQPLITLFSIDRSIPMANERNFTFMLESLEDVSKKIEAVGASFHIMTGYSPENVIRVAKEASASVIVTDESHLNEGKKRRQNAADNLNMPVFQVDSNVIVPVREIPGEQYAAYTIRPKLTRLFDAYLKPIDPVELKIHRDISIGGAISKIDIKKILKELKLPKVQPAALKGGESKAIEALQNFIDKKLDDFAEKRNDPSLENTSNMSPYLRFGNISPVKMIIVVRDSGGKKESIGSFIEEAFVRRELAENFTFYNKNYRAIDALPEWARKTLDDHRKDKREYIYSLEELENSGTHDELWNACQHEMVSSGKMAGYMRMVWGKCVIEWTETPEEAMKFLIYLNDKYELDGRCPNGYAGIQWCFGKHDRAFGEREVTGKLRYMNTAGARRKFDIDGYIQKTGYLKKLKASV